MTEHAPEAVAERRVVERVEERVDGRVGVAEPERQLVDEVVDGRRDERLDDEHGEVRDPADGEGDDHRRHRHYRLPLIDDLRRLLDNKHQSSNNRYEYTYPGLPPRIFVWTVSSELLCFWFYFFLIFSFLGRALD